MCLRSYSTLLKQKELHQYNYAIVWENSHNGTRLNTAQEADSNMEESTKSIFSTFVKAGYRSGTLEPLALTALTA